MGPAVDAAPAAGLCVEFLGLPGAGKSTLAHAVTAELRVRGVRVTPPRCTNGRRDATLGRLGIKLWYAIRGAVQAPRRTLFWLKLLAESRQAHRGDWWGSALNWFYLLGITRQRASHPGIQLLDQGVFQALWSVGYAAQQRGVLSSQLLPQLRATLPPRILVVLVGTSAATATQRLRHRDGKSRLERDLARGSRDSRVATALEVLDQVHGVALSLARERRIVLQEIVNDVDDALPATAAALTDAIVDLLAPASPAAAPAAAPVPMSRTDRALGGWLWMTLGAAVQGTVMLGVLAVLARLLSPLDFGAVASGLLIINLSAVLTQSLVSAAVVQHPKLETAHIRTAFAVAVFGSLLLCAGLWWLAPLIAHDLRSDSLRPIVRALAWLLPVQAVGSVAEALLRRELQFPVVARARMVSYTIGYGIVGTSVAASGGGLWALVAANGTQVTAYTILLLRAKRHSLRLAIHGYALRELLSFSGAFTLGSIGNYGAVNGDYLVVVKALGVAALGLYERAYDLMAKPAAFVGQVLDYVLFPVMSQIQDQRDRVANAYRRCVGAVALACLPLTVMVLILAPEIVRVVLGPHWDAVTLPFRVLAVGTLFRTSYKVSDSLTRALGAVYRRAWRQWTYAACVIGGASVGQRWGLEGVATAVLIALLANFLLTAHLGTRLVGMSWRDYVAAHGAGLKASVIVAVPALIAATTARSVLHAPAIAVLGITVGGVLLVTVPLFLISPITLLGRDGRWLLERATQLLRRRGGAREPRARRAA